ncbi:hypothetical protein [Halomarina litorea]|uniref:hypothetical protein n=1 Tax=Halomarina litorea TaxID=2961595 RepID=UPI0020C51092|nr:hypothetical protein [Halomarina sp. BCD28]
MRTDRPLVRGHIADVFARTSLLLRVGGDPSVAAAALRRAFRRWYLSEYCRLTVVTTRQVRAWELPVAAARLTEGGPESDRLRAFVAERLG